MRGTVVWVDLADARPPELGKQRPGVVVSNTQQNAVLETVVIVPLSSRPPDIWPLRVPVGPPRLKPSFAVIPGIRQVSKRRLLSQGGRLSTSDLEAVDEALRAYLSD